MGPLTYSNAYARRQLPCGVPERITYPMNILHIDSSVTGANSVSRPLSQAAAEQLKSANPGATYVYRDVVKNTLRHYTAVLRSHGADKPEQLTPEQKAELETGKEILAEFMAADTVLLGAPMYNFCVPSQLKAWIDLICVAGTTFKYSASGAEGLCGGKKVIVISSRGGLYGPGSPYAAFDHQEKYLRDIFTFLGVKDITVITAEGVAYGPDKAAESVNAAKAKIAELK